MPLPNSFDFTDGAGTVFLLEPNAVNDRPVALQLSGEVVDTPVNGVRYTAKDGSLPGGVWTFEYLTVDRPTLQFLKDFVDTQSGMAGKRLTGGGSQGFWFPTWQWELEVANYDANTIFTDFVWLEPRGYVAGIFPLGPQWRRWVAVFGDDYIGYKVNAATSDAGFEKLDGARVGSSGAGAFPARPWTRAAGVRPLWLRYGRLDADDFTYEHVDGGDAFQVTLTIRELPDEASDED